MGYTIEDRAYLLLPGEVSVIGEGIIFKDRIDFAEGIRMARKAHRLVGVVLALAALLVGTQAFGSLFVDLKFADGTDTYVVHPADIGTNVTIQAWSRIAGTGPSVWYTAFGVRSRQAVGTDGVTGAFAGGGIAGPSTRLSPFDNSAGLNGILSSAITADGIMDIGSTSGAPNSNCIRPRTSGTFATGAELEMCTLEITIGSAILGAGETWFDPFGAAYPNPSSYTENGSTFFAKPSAGTSVKFVLAPTQVVMAPVAPLFLDKGGAPVQLMADGMVTDGFGAIAGYAWDLNNDGQFETLGNPIITYEQINAMWGDVGKDTRPVGYEALTTDGHTSTAMTTLTITPEPATMALLALGAIAAIRRRMGK